MVPNCRLANSLLLLALLTAAPACSSGDKAPDLTAVSDTPAATDVGTAADSAPETTPAPDAGPHDATTDAAEPWPWSTCPEYETNGPSLAEKTAFLDNLVLKQHLLPTDGLLRTVTLDENGDFAAFHHLPSTGLWTAIYLASQSLRYAVTGNPEAQANAAIAVEGLHHLTAVTGVPGLYGRGYRRPDVVYSGEVAGSSSWTESTVPGYEGWWFNHDVSKDTMDGIMFGYSVALEHLDDEAILNTIRADAGAFVEHLVSNGLQIIDVSGVVTEHGRLYYSAMDDFPGFNAILAASWIRVVLSETEDPDLEHFYYDCLMRVGDNSDCPDIEVVDLGSYMDAIETMLSLYMDNCQTSFDHYDMIFHAVYPLLRRENNADLKQRLRKVLDVGIWQPADPSLDPPVHQSTHSLYIFMYGGLAKPPPTNSTFYSAVEDAVCTLYRLPQDRHQYAVPPGTQEGVCINRMGRPNAAEVIPVEEREYDNYIWRLDSYEIPVGMAEVPGLVHSPEDYLLAYWIGRYHGYISGEM